MGVLYEKDDNGKEIREVTPELKEKVLASYYWKHHHKLNTAVNNQLDSYEKAIIINSSL